MSWQLVISTLVALLGSTGLLRMIDAIGRRRVVRVEIADKVNEMTLEWAAAVKADAFAARSEAQTARAEASEARRQMATLSAEIEAATARLRMWRTAALSPVATLEGLRLMITSELGTTQEN